MPYTDIGGGAEDADRGVGDKFVFIPRRVETLVLVPDRGLERMVVLESFGRGETRRFKHEGGSPRGQATA